MLPSPKDRRLSRCKASRSGKLGAKPFAFDRLRSTDLSSDRRSEVEAANKAFESSVEGIVGELGSSLLAADAKAGIVTALQQLAASYQKAFAPLNCD
jgi:hypothetical protein